MSLYVLAERFGHTLNPRTGGGHDLVELLMFSHGGQNRPALFLSPVDAGICLNYLNKRPAPGGENRYEIRIHSDPAVVMTITKGVSVGLRPTLIMGFATDLKTGKLFVQGGCYSMAHMPLLEEDTEWIFGRRSKPRIDVISSAFKELASRRVENYEDEINKLDLMEPDDVHKVAAIALAQLGVLMSGQQGGLSLYYPSRRAWARLI